MPGISPKVFRRNVCALPNALGSDIAALLGITRLYLALANYKDRSAPEYCDNIEGLPKLLGSMHSLQCLSLELSTDLSEDSLSLYNYNQVFPKVMT